MILHLQKHVDKSKFLLQYSWNFCHCANCTLRDGQCQQLIIYMILYLKKHADNVNFCYTGDQPITKIWFCTYRNMQTKLIHLLLQLVTKRPTGEICHCVSHIFRERQHQFMLQCWVMNQPTIQQLESVSCTWETMLISLAKLDTDKDQRTCF